MAGYTRQSTFADGDTITAALFNNEYNQLLNAFSNTGGHKHDGTANEGPVIGLIGDAGVVTPLNKVLIDSTNDHIEFWIEVSSSSVQQLYIADGAIIPVTDSDVDLGTSSLYFKNAYIDSITTTGNVAVGGNLTVTGTTTFNGGTITMGDAATDNVVFGADVDSNIIPDDDDSYDLGSSSQEWRNLYIDGTANIDSLVADTADINGGTIDGAVIGGSSAAAITGTAITGTSFVIGSATITEAELEILDGATVTTDELNILDGVTSTAAELNLLDGVTSTTAELNILDGVTASAADINLIDGITNGTVIASKAIITDANKDITGGRNITISGELDAGSLDVSGNVDVDGTLETDALSINGTAVTSTAAELNLLDGKAFLDEDDMSSNSATGIASQQSIKAYVDTQITAEDLDITTDSGTIAIDLDSETLTVSGGTGLDSSATGNAVTLAIDSTVATLTGSQTLTNKTLTSPDVNTPDIDGGTIDGTVIGGATPAAGTFTTLTANTSLTGTLATAAQPNITSLGTLTGLTTTGDINFGDSDKAIFGAGSDLEIYHDGSNSYISESNATGNLFIKGTNIYLQNSSGQDALNLINGNAFIKSGGATKLATTSTGIDITGNATFDDNGKAIFGAGSDLQIYHDGSNSYVKDAGTGDLYIQGEANVRITDGDGNKMFLGQNDGEVQLYYNGLEKLNTTNTGIDVTGTATMDGIDVTGRFTVASNDGHSDTKIISTSNRDPRLYFLEGTTQRGYIQSTAGTSQLLFGTGSTEGMRLTSTGLGIGTTSPSANLEVRGSGSNGQIYLGGSTSATYGKMYSDNDGTLILAADAGNNAGSSSFRVEVDGGERLRLDSSGNLLVGKTSSSGNTVGVELRSNGGIFGTKDGAYVARFNRKTSDGSIVEFQKDGSTVGSIGTNGSRLSIGSGDVNLNFNASANSIYPISNVDGTLSDNLVDLGATAARFKDLHLRGSVYADLVRSYDDTDTYVNFAGSNVLSFITGASERARIDSQGNLLVGSTSFNTGAFGATKGINVAHTQPIVLLHETDTDKDGYIGMASSTMFIGTADAIPMRFSTSDTERMRITSSGAIGFGTTPPSDTHTGWNQFFIGQKASLFSENATGTHGLDGTFITDNIYVDSDTGSFANIETNESSAYRQEGGEHHFYSQASGSAGAAVTLSEKMRIDSSGNVGIGQTSLGHKLTVNASAFDGIQLQSGGSDCGYLGVNTDTVYVGAGSNLIFHTGNAGLTNGTERMRIDSNGNIAIGGTSASNFSGYVTLDLRDTTGGLIDFSEVSAGVFARIQAVVNNSLSINNRQAYPVTFGTNDTERMRIDASGSLLVGTTNSNPVNLADHRLVVELNSSTAGIAVGADGLVDSRQVMTFYNDNGTAGTIVTSGSSTAYNTSSDYRLKENVDYTWNATTRLKQLKPARFNFIADETNTLVDGFLAHEVSSIVPEAISGEKDGTEMQGIDQSKLVPLLVKTIQELEARITALES